MPKASKLATLGEIATIRPQAPHRLKKTFKTTWSVKTDKFGTDVVLPDDVKFLDLYAFTGQQTKVTIEVIG